jgi:hypothetical protein
LETPSAPVYFSANKGYKYYASITVHLSNLHIVNKATDLVKKIALYLPQVEYTKNTSYMDSTGLASHIEHVFFLR